MSEIDNGPYRWVFFDVDQTLCDFLAMKRRALARSLAEIEARWPDLAGRYQPDDLEEIRNRIAGRYEGRPVPLVQVRREMFASVLSEVDAADTDVDEITDHYLASRFADPILFDDVRPALEALRRRHRLGVISNGNSKLASLRLESYFEAEFVAEKVGFAKPDPRIYQHAAAAVDADPKELIMVGDSYRNDVEAAERAGWRAVWLQRNAPAEPPTMINSLAALIAVL